MELTLTNAMDILIDVIGNKKTHKDYDKVVKMKDTLTKLATGENMDSLMRRFNRRESEEAFQQRKDITQHITKTVFRNLMKPAFKIPRSNGLQRILSYVDDNENQKLRKFEVVTDNFWGDQSVDDYMAEQWIESTYTDPNSYIVFEWGDYDEQRQRPQPYPFEVSAEEAIYPYWEENVLQFLISKNVIVETVGNLTKPEEADQKKKDVPVSYNASPIRYTMYLKNRTIVLDQVLNTEKKYNQVEDNTFLEGGKYVKISGDLYRITLPKEHNLGVVPAYRVGFKYDIATRKRTCISPIDEAVPILMKIVKANSELDLTMALHAFPQKLQYKKACQNKQCNNGHLPDGSTCPECGGSGKDVHTSAQDIIELKMPRDAEDVVSLSSLIHYVYPPVDLVKFQDDYIKTLASQCKEAIYNSEIFSKKEIAETATGKNIDLQNVYDALYSMAQAYSDRWEFSMKMISMIVKMDKGLVAKLIFSRDFKMKSLSELYMDLKEVSDSRADAFIKDGIQDDIARIMYADNEYLYKRYRTQRTFYPYSGKSKEEILAIVNTVPMYDYNKILWESYGWIFNELEIEAGKKGENFYDYNRDKQNKQIKKKVNKIIEDRKKEVDINSLYGQADTESGEEGQETE